MFGVGGWVRRIKNVGKIEGDMIGWIKRGRFVRCWGLGNLN